MAREPRDKDERRSKIFRGVGGQKAEVEPDETKVHTEAVTDDKGTTYKSSGKGYKGKHRQLTHVVGHAKLES